MANQQAGGGGFAAPNASPKGALTYAQLRAATPFQGTAINPGGLGGGSNSANATEHDLLSALAAHAAAQHPAAAALPAAPPDPYAAMDPAQMAAQQFAPQYALLDQLTQQSKNQYTQAGNNVGGMWDALARATAGDEGNIKKNYSAAGSAIGKAYNDATAATNNAYSSSRNQIADIAKRLGVEAAVPSALAQGVDHQGLLDALIGNSGASYQGLNTVLGNNEVDFNRNNAHIDTQAGINARSDFAGKLQAALQQLGQQRLTLQGQQNAAQNQYGLDISKQKQTAADNAAKLAQTTENNRAQHMLDEAKLKQAADQFNAQNGNKNLSATEYLAQQAAQQYGNLQAATNAKNAILDTVANGDSQGNKHWTNASDFVRSVLDRNPNAQHSGGDYRQLEQLALDYYTRLAGGANKAI